MQEGRQALHDQQDGHSEHGEGTKHSEHQYSPHVRHSQVHGETRTEQHGPQHLGQLWKHDTGLCSLTVNYDTSLTWHNIYIYIWYFQYD